MMVKTTITRRPGRMSAYRQLQPAGPLWLRLALLATLLAGSIMILGHVGIGQALAVALPGRADRPTDIAQRGGYSGNAVISETQALFAAREFDRGGDLQLSGGLQVPSLASGGRLLYYLESTDGSGLASFQVDGRTGEVIEMTRLDRLGGLSESGFGAVEAEASAERFAAEHFAGFAALSLVERTSASGPGESVLYTFKWSLLAADSGAELPTSVSLSISSSCGEAVWYLAQRQQATVSALPAVTRDAAVAIGQRAADLEQSGEGARPPSVRLQVIYNATSQQQLVWAISFSDHRAGLTADRVRQRVLIDAQSGELIANPA